MELISMQTMNSDAKHNDQVSETYCPSEDALVDEMALIFSSKLVLNFSICSFMLFALQKARVVRINSVSNRTYQNLKQNNRDYFYYYSNFIWRPFKNVYSGALRASLSQTERGYRRKRWSDQQAVIFPLTEIGIRSKIIRFR